MIASGRSARCPPICGVPISSTSTAERQHETLRRCCLYPLAKFGKALRRREAQGDLGLEALSAVEDRLQFSGSRRSLRDQWQQLVQPRYAIVDYF